MDANKTNFAIDTAVTCEWCGKGFATLNGLSGHKPCRLDPAFNQAHALAVPVPTQHATATAGSAAGSAATTTVANAAAATNAATVKPSAVAAAAVLKEARESKAR